MASEEELRKINVRSPYFVNVTKPVSDGGVESDDTGGGEEPFEEPTEPVVETTTISCGDTRNIGFGIGIHRYEFSTLGKQIGDYDINFSGIKMPFYAKVGIKGNMPSEYTFMVGHSSFDGNWLDAVGTPVPSSTTISSHPDGNDQTITYTSTQSDIDTYGETVLLETFHPVINIENIQFVLDCPNAVVSLAEDSGQQSVFILTIKNDTVLPEYLTGAATNKLNDEDAPWLTFPDVGKTKSYVFGVHSPDLAPFFLNTKHLGDRKLPVWNSPDHTVVYRPADSLFKLQNVVELHQKTGNNFGQSRYSVFMSTHRIELFTGSGRNNDEAFITRAGLGNVVIGDINAVSILTLDTGYSGISQSKYGFEVSPFGNSCTQTIIANMSNTSESVYSLDTNHIKDGSLKILGLFENGTSIQDQTFELIGVPER